MISRYKFNVPWGDTDAARIVFYPNFYRYMDEATDWYLQEVLLDPYDLYLQGFVFPILEAHCTFKKPLRYHDTVEVHSKILALRSKTLHIEHSFYVADALHAQGYEWRVLCVLKDEQVQSVMLPEEMKQKLLGG